MPPHLLRFVLVVAVALAVSGGDPAAAAGADDAYDASKCQKSFRCGHHDIHYPLYLANESQSYCGYPGMAILCDATSTPANATLRLAENTSYTVLAIDYTDHTITLADADALASNSDCPRPRHNVTIPAYAWLNFTATGNSTISFFLNCSFTPTNPLPLDIIPINCTGFSQGPSEAPSFLAPQLGVPDGDWFRACQEMYVAPVLTSEWLVRQEYRPRLGSGGYGEVLRRGFRLSWDTSKGPCYECEATNGQCGYDQFGGFQGCLCSDGRVRQDCGSKRSTRLKTLSSRPLPHRRRSPAPLRHRHHLVSWF